jgi:hypothetical protein
MNRQQTNKKHRCQYTGDNGEDGRHLEVVDTSTKTSETDQGVTVPPIFPSRGATWHPTWVHTWLIWVLAEVGNEGWVQDVPSGDPAPLLLAITLPVNQVLKTPALWSNPQAGWPPVTRGEGLGLEMEDKGL